MGDESPETTNTESDDIVSNIVAAIEATDSQKLLQLIVDQQFVLISVSTDEETDNDDEAMGAITAEVDDYEVLVAFTSEPLAGQFVDAMGDMFDNEDQVQGFIVDGEALLDYLPDDYGLLLNPETEHTALIKPDLAQQVITASDTE